MEKAKLKQLIIEHKKRFLVKSGLVKRDIQKDIEKILEQREIVALTGVRRSGKSSLMKLVASDITDGKGISSANILYLNFEDERFTDFSVDDFEKIYELYLELYRPEGRNYFFLDEIQNVREWQRWVNRLYEFENIKIFITGSNASFLSSEISSSLTGRCRHLVNWPFSFKEYLRLVNLNVEEKELLSREGKIRVKNALSEYFKYGGFPEAAKNRDSTLLEQYFKDIIYRDIAARYSVRNLKELKEITLYLSTNIARIYSYEKIRNLIGAKSMCTVKNYFEMLENVFLFFRVNIFDWSVKKQIYNPGKFYSIDVALSNETGFRFSEDMEHVYENLVFLQLKRKGEDIYYWKSKKGNEVDFVIRQGPEIEKAIQVCFALDDPEVQKREIKALLEARKELKVQDLIVITDDDERMIEADDAEIKVVSIWKWLLE